MNLEEIQDAWTADARIDITEPSKELAKIPILHAKYLRELNFHTLRSKKLMVQLKKLEKFKKDYYSGDLNNPEDLAKYDIEPFQGHLSGPKITKVLEADDDILKLSLDIEEAERAHKSCETILKELNNRTFQLRAIIDHEKWIGGQ
jgi:hypothetical protein